MVHTAAEAEFRRATPEDLELIEAAEHAYMREVEPVHEAEWLTAIDRNRTLWAANLEHTHIAVLAATPVGYAMWTREQDVATLITIHVAQGHRRLGLGAVLLTNFVQEARLEGCTELRLGVHRDNPAQALYERAGFAFVDHDGEYLLYELREA